MISGKYGIVLSGHQVNTSLQSTFKNKDGVVINSNPSEWKSYRVSTGDCAFIPFDSSMNFIPTEVINNPTSGATSLINTTQFITSPGLLGYPIAQYGNSSGKQTGNITALFSSFTTEDGF